MFKGLYKMLGLHWYSYQGLCPTTRLGLWSPSKCLNILPKHTALYCN